MLYEVKDKLKSDQVVKVTPFRKEVRKTTAHKHNKYLEIVLLTKGEGTHTIDMRSYEIHPPQIFFIRKDQLHHWDITTEPEGVVLIIKNDFVRQVLDKELIRLVEQLSSMTELKLREIEFISDIFRLLLEEMNGQHPSQIVWEGLLKSVLYKIIQQGDRLSWSKLGTIYEAYLNLLYDSRELVNNVAFYAEKLTTTPQNLNRICRQEKNKSASEILAEAILSEAKRKLVYTDLPVNAIGDSLGFKDASHFTRYFKKHIGYTPSVYRSISC